MKKQIYTIAVLDDKDYLLLDEQFPNIKKEDLHNSLGFADKETGEAYVRRTSIKDVDMATVQHEIQELIADTSSHEKDGIRYGWFSKIGKWAEKTFLPEKVKEKIAKTPIINDLVSRGWLGTVPQQFTPEGREAYAKGTGTSGIIHNYVEPLILGAAGGMVGGPLLGTAMGAATGVGHAPSSKDMPMGAVRGAGMGFTGATIGSSLLGRGAISSVPTGASATIPAAPAPIGSLSNAFKASQASKFGTPLSLGGQSYLATGGAGGLSAVPAAAGAVGSAFAPQLSGLLGKGKAFPQAGEITAPAGGITTTPPAEITTPPIPPSKIGGIDVGGGAGAGTETAPTFMEGLSKTLTKPSTLLGAGSLLGGAATPQPEFQMPESVEQIRSKLLQAEGGGLTDVGQQARMELGEILKSTPQELYPTATDEYYNAALRRTRESYSEAERQLDAAYNVAGVYGSGEHLAEKAKLKENLARTESALAAETEQRRFELATTAKYQALQDALGVDQNVMNDLVGLTALDVQTAAMMYGAEVADVQAIREALGTLGIELILRGMPGQVSSNQGAMNIA